jgi:sugar-specific transcriptional regulator TrmB
MKEENILIQAGLGEEQALTYQALLDKGPQKASDIASWTGVKRATTYKILEELIHMGIVEKNETSGAVAVFFPLHPKNLLAKIEQRQKELETSKELLTYSLGSLVSKFNLIHDKPNIQFFEGKEAIAKITGDFPEKDTEIRQFLDIENALDYFPNETTSYLQKRVAKQISKRMIVSNSIFNTSYAEKGSELTTFRIAKEVATFPTAIQVYDDRTTLLTMNPSKTIGLVIDDKEIAETFKLIFDGYWDRVAVPPLPPETA